MGRRLLSHNKEKLFMSYYNEKLYVCPECKKEFRDNSNLNRHFLIHS